jgi:hypothetical protein
MDDLTRKVVRLAYEKPEFRHYLLPIIKEARSVKVRAKALGRDIEKYLQKLTQEFAKYDMKDPVSDAGVWVGDEAKRKGRSEAPVIFHFDGNANDFFSYHENMGHKYRDEIFKLGKKHGFHGEDMNNWSMGFWDE